MRFTERTQTILPHSPKGHAFTWTNFPCWELLIVLKSGCKAEDSKLRIAQRLTNLIAVYGIIAWRLFWLTMAHLTNPKTSAAAVFTETEIGILNQIAGDPEQDAPKNVAHYLLAVAKLGGYLARKNDGPLGNTVI